MHVSSTPVAPSLRDAYLSASGLVSGSEVLRRKRSARAGLEIAFKFFRLPVVLEVDAHEKLPRLELGSVRRLTSIVGYKSCSQFLGNTDVPLFWITNAP